MHDDQKNEWLLNAAEKVLNVIELKIKFPVIGVNIFDIYPNIQYTTKES